MIETLIPFGWFLVGLGLGFLLARVRKGARIFIGDDVASYIGPMRSTSNATKGQIIFEGPVSEKKEGEAK